VFLLTTLAHFPPIPSISSERLHERMPDNIARRKGLRILILGTSNSCSDSQALIPCVAEGAGAKGLSSLTMLGEVMDRVRDEEELEEAPDVHEWFEFAVGTDTAA
jgi:hypothetical protein